MAKRDALRELQSRLSSRLMGADDVAPSATWLAVECAGSGLLLPMVGAGEILAVPPLQPVAHTRPWFLGVGNLRGRLHGIVDLAAFLGLRAALPAGAPVAESARVLSFNPALGAQAAVLVDRLAGLRAEHQLTALPDEAGGAPRPGFAGRAFSDAGGQRWQEIDLAALAAHPAFLAIST